MHVVQMPIVPIVTIVYQFLFSTEPLSVITIAWQDVCKVQRLLEVVCLKLQLHVLRSTALETRTFRVDSTAAVLPAFLEQRVNFVR